MNGTQVAASVTGGYVRNVYDLTALLKTGTNSLAIEMHPNDPTKMLTLDNVDWSQIPPDNNTGIQFPVQLEAGGGLVVDNAHVNQNTAADLSSSALTVKADVVNTTASSQTGTVTATVTPPGGGSPITVSQSVTVAANSTGTVSFAPAGNPALTIAHPQIWWPYQMGAQPLYTLTTAVSQNSTVLNTATEKFGIRNTTTRLVGSSTGAPQGCVSSRSTASPSTSAAAAGTRTSSCATARPTPPSRSACSRPWASTPSGLRATSCPTTGTSRWTPPDSW
ncbi:hypothetical protein ACFQ9X_24755 [Catenulispora yoronensis]